MAFFLYLIVQAINRGADVKDARTFRKHSIVVKLAGLLLPLGMMVAFVAGPILATEAKPPLPLEEEPAVELPSDTSPEEHGLGFLPSDPAEHPITPLPDRIASITELPPAVDLSQPSLIQEQPSDNGLPPIGDQEATDTCVGWAAGYYYKTYQEWREHGWEVKNGGPDYDHIFSVNFVYNQVAELPDPLCQNGAMIGDALELIVNEGDVPWNIFPWNANNCSTQPTSSQRDAALDYTGIDYGAFFISTGPPYGPEQNHDITPLKQWLADDDPFILAFPVYYEFDDAGCYTPVMPPSDQGTFRGLHAVAVIGYDDYWQGVGAFRIINSWGTGWGCYGYTWLSYEFVQKYAWEAWWMTSNRPPWIDPLLPDHLTETGNWIFMDLTPYENDREDSGTALKWYVGGNDHCTVVGEGSSNDYLGFYPDPPGYVGFDDLILRLEDSEGAVDTQQIRLVWYSREFSSYVPLVLRNYPD
jgi:hypothetical protein